MEDKKKKNAIDRVWDALSSIKFAIVVFALIAGTSMVGTVIEQGAEPARNVKILSDIVGDSLAPAAYSVLDSLGFMDMYHSWWFILFLMAFALNLLVCSLDRFPAIWKVAREPLKPLLDEQFKVFPIKREVTVKGKPDEVKELLRAGLRSIGFRDVREADGQLYAQTSPVSRLGVYITHMSILIILAGAMAGIFFGFKGSANVGEGETAYIAFMRVPLNAQEKQEREAVWVAYDKSKGDMATAAASLGVDPEHLKARMKRLGLIPFGFGLRCDAFNLELYGNSDMPKAYQSTLSVIDGGQRAVTKKIVVNDPLTYKGITFYQSSYGVNQRSDHVKFILNAGASGSQAAELTVNMDEDFKIPGTGMTAKITDYSPALSFDPSGNAFTYNEEMMVNPAVKLEVQDGAQKSTHWLAKRYPQTWAITPSVTVQLKDIWGLQYTGLQVRKDPGVWIVYLGCLMMGIGLFFAFFMVHRRIWVRVRADKGSVAITVAASAHKYRESLEKKIDRALALIKDGGK